MNLKNLFLISFISFLFWFRLIATVPSSINYQGALSDNQGNEFNGTISVDIKVFDSSSGGNQLFQETVGTVQVTNGLYSFQFGSTGNSIRQSTEKIGEGNSSATNFSFTTSKYPIINPSVQIADGNNTWSDNGITNSSFSAAVNHATGSVSVTYSSTPLTSGTSLYISYQYLENGIYGALIDSNQSWVELTIDGHSLTPRQRLITVPFAMLAKTAKEVEKESITLDMLGSSVRNRLSQRGIAEFTSTATWTVPENVDRIYVEMWGGGGGGGRSKNDQYYEGAGGGGSGGYVRAILDVSFGETLTMTIGTGGLKATTDLTNGGQGGETSIYSNIRGYLAKASGGTGGSMNLTTKKSVGGLGGTGEIILGTGITREGNRGDHRAYSHSTPSSGTPGGTSIKGSIEKTTPNYSHTTNLGSYGAGGEGASRGNSYPDVAQDGIDGHIYIEW